MRTEKPAHVTAIKPNVVGPTVRSFHTKAGVPQEELAARCEERGLKLSRGTLAKIESQTRFITACELFVIAKVLKAPLKRLFPPGYGDPKPAAPRKRA